MPNVSDDLLLERYKHVLGQMAKIDENAHKFLAIYQTTATALIGGIVALWLGHERLGISADRARSGTLAGLFVIGAVGLFTVTVLVVGAFAWMDYRREETLLTASPSQFHRPAATWRNLWRWQETYMILLVLGVSVGVVLLGAFWVLPSLAP